ncbi:MAG: hypothetical protein EU541_05045 [Promethearchaeota archaeon]|nr:MAG: hypothetical protein EU541_05045 [Candidatus Lokiarchaeota archaeon]
MVCISIVDVVIDKIIIEQSPDDKTKDRNIALTQLGAILGAIYPNIIFYILFTDLYSMTTWRLFFMIGIFSLSPVLFMGFLVNVKNNMPVNEEIITEDAVDFSSIILLCVILFLFHGERIYEYPLEPWVLNKFGEQYFSLLVLLLIVLIIINALGVILGSIISNKLNRKLLLMISSAIYGMLLIIVPFTNFIWFFVFFAIMQIFSGIIVVNLGTLMIKYSKNKVTYFQFMALFGIMALVIFIPLGTYLSSIIATEIIIIIAGVFKLISIIPIYFLIIKNEKTD